MSGETLRKGREKAGLTQAQAAEKLHLTQAYLSMLERGQRPVTAKVEVLATKLFHLDPMVMPLDRSKPKPKSDKFKAQLGALGYPGFAYLRAKPCSNPARLLFSALDRDDLDRRVAEALPWVVCQYPDMDWKWLTQNSKLHDRQNRLGFVVDLAGRVAEKNGNKECQKKLQEYAATVKRSKLAKEDTLANESMTQAERKWLRSHRPAEARHWNLLTDLDVKDLAYVSA